MNRNFKALLFLVILTAFGANVFGGHSTLDMVDPAFNPNVQTNLYGGKIVHQVQILPDGKILVFGFFSSFNRVPTGRVVRLNADGSIDPTFNTRTVTSSDNSGGRVKIVIQPDGKIVLAASNIVADGQPPKSLVRLNSDGTLDTSFNYALNLPSDITVDSSGRILLVGFIQTPQGTRSIVRLNGDGSLDPSFSFTTNDPDGIGLIAPQENRLIVGGGNARIFRLSENGSEDPSFPPISTSGLQLNALIVQPDSKILYQNDRLRRLYPNGDTDTSFQTSPATGNLIKLAPDGKIVVTSSASNATFRRYLPNGAVDSSFNQYTHPSFSYCFSIQSDGGIVTGDQSNFNISTLNINNFIRLMPGGMPDSSFNPDGIGFQNILPGSIRAIEPQANGKILLGGKFDVINDTPRSKLARLNTDSTVDASFQINTNGSGNYFSIIRDVYQIRVQNDGRIVVSGYFDYVLGGAAKRNLVRLNSDGSIDPTFNLAHPMPDYSEIVRAGRNHFAILGDGSLVVGTSKNSNLEQSGPIKLSANGAIETTFNPTLNNQSPQMYIDDVAIQPDGKILIGGSRRASNVASFVSFVARLNADGSTDSTFLYSEEPNRLKTSLALLPNGKILVGRHADGSLFGKVERFNADGNRDDTFNALSIPGGIINALLVLPNGKILVGGKFTVAINGGQSKNLVRLTADGNFEPTIYNLNEEVLCLAADGGGRVLVGGAFTVIGANGGAGADRSYVARLTDSNAQFDFDGDGRSDIAVFRPANGTWYLHQSAAGFAGIQFGISSDKIVPADYDGDGKTDVAVYRGGTWYLNRSQTGFTGITFGTSEDVPVPADYDGDGKADLAVFRPSNGTWYLNRSTQGFTGIQFGISTDKPVTADFDGDGKADLAVYRGGTWYLQRSQLGFTGIQFGTAEDKIAPADYDGDGKADLGVFRPSNGTWYLQRSTAGFAGILFGGSNDAPAPADYDGDGKTDVAVVRNGIWYLNRSTQGSTGIQFGISTDMPIPNVFVQ